MLRRVPIALCLWPLAFGGCSAISDLPTAWLGMFGPTPVEPTSPPAHAETVWKAIAISPGGSPVEAATLGQGSGRVYIIGCLRGDEPEAAAAADFLPAAIGAALDASATVRIVRNLNPDGAATRGRTNARGVDLSRNWPHAHAPDSPGTPLSEPETRAVHDDMAAFDPQIAVILRSSHRGPSVWYQSAGAGGFAAAHRFVSAARAEDPRWRVMPIPLEPSPGSIGTFIAEQRKTPVLVVEFQRGAGARTSARAAAKGLQALLHDPGLAP